VYRISNSNLAQTSLENGNTNANVKELAGEVTSEGAELELQTRSWHGLSMVGAYSYNETKYTASNTYIVGSRLRYNPSHTANLDLYYTFCVRSPLRGFNIGANWYYVGNRVAGRSTRVQVANDAYQLMEIPDYSQFDVSLGYTHHEISVRLKVSNVADVLSYNIIDVNSFNPFAPSQFGATVSYKF
jgi:iron complex outermembrane receptor protein